VNPGLRATGVVAKYSPTPHPPESAPRLRVHYLTGEGALVEASLEGIDSPLCSGAHEVTFVRGTRRQAISLTIAPRGKVFDLEARGADDASPIQGLGIVDPEFEESLLVSWGCARHRPTGIVKYRLGQQPDTIVAVYTSVMLESIGFDDVLGGLAVGPTDDGFAGRYSITYEGADNTSFGPYDWTITPRGSAFDLTWDAQGQRVIEGFGFPDPESDRSIVVVYGAPALSA
jgi:hypothetical protein